MRIVKQQELLRDVVGVLDADVPRQFGQHPNSFAPAESTSRVPEAAIRNHGIQELEGFRVLDSV